VGLPLLSGAAAVGATSAAGNTVDRQEYANRLRATRNAYFKVITAGNSAADTEAHAALAAFERAYPGDAVAKAYHGSLELLDAAHSWQVWNLHRQAADGLSLLDAAVAQAPEEPEVRFLRAATDWHLPGFYHRRQQGEADFALLAGRAEDDARLGKLPPELAAAALNYWGQILVGRGDREKAKSAFSAAMRIAPASPAGQDAARHAADLR